MGYPVTLNGRTYTLADFEGNNYVDGLPDAFEDFVTHAGDVYNDTSTTSNTIGTGSKTFTVTAGKPYQAGTPLRIADAAAPATNFLDAVVTSYSGTTLVVEAIGYGGSGTKTSWTVNIGGAKTIDGTLGVSQGGTGATTAAAARTNLDTYSKTEADSRFLNVSGEASNVTMTGNVTIGDADTDTLTINATTTATADIEFGDNDKAIFGAGSDLQIYHDGSESIIKDAGTGNLKILATNLRINNADSSKSYITGVDGSYVNLYYNGSQKLVTTSSGIDVTGTAVTDGLTVAGNVSVDGGTIKLDGNYPTGTANVALGDNTLNGSLTGGSNTAVGEYVMGGLTSGTSNSALGQAALGNNTTGSYNTAVGRTALFSNTTASNNTAVGYQAGYSNTTGANITAVGRYALYNNNGDENTAFGNQSMFGNTSGVENSAFGTKSLEANTTGSYNVAVGKFALKENTTASYNTAVGYNTLYSNTTGAQNTAVGREAARANTTGTANVAIGQSALAYNTTGNTNIAVGEDSLLVNTTASSNTAIGHQSLRNTTADHNTAVGYQAAYSNTTGTHLVAIGRQALISNTTGSLNSAVGQRALRLNSTGANNVAVGYEALLNNTTASNNTVVGYQAGYSNVTGQYNTFLGKASGYASTSSFNTYLGHDAGLLMTSGENNTILGRYNGNQGGLDIRTSSNHIVLSDGDGNPRMHIDNSGYVKAVGIYNYTTASSANVHVLSNGYLQRSTSSLRYKNTVNDATHGLTELLTLRPVTYKGNNDGDTVFGGLIAEEVHDAGLTEFVQYNDDGEPDALAYGNMVSLCIKAIQDQQATITALEARITALENA